MSQPAGYYADPAALAAYGSAVPGLAAQLDETGSTTLSGVTALPADCFGQVGQEVGLTAAFQQAAQHEVDGLGAAVAALDALATAVRGANTGYAQQDEDHAGLVNRSTQV
ncbi:MAG: hypothetical protein M3291_15500 [Actinomycetota bacterium]|nr:hypothetical protein [Actinomycetota bacterium]